MKAGIVNVYHALKAFTDLKISPQKRLVIILNSDEETGNSTSSTLITEEALKKHACSGAGGPCPTDGCDEEIAQG